MALSGMTGMETKGPHIFKRLGDFFWLVRGIIENIRHENGSILLIRIYEGSI